MSVSLLVERGGKTEIYPMAGQSTATNHLFPLARQLNLLHLKQLDTFHEITFQNINVIITEFDLLLQSMQADPAKWGIVLENLQRVRSVLQELQGLQHWKASWG